MGDPGVLASETSPDQTDLQDLSSGWVLPWAFSGSQDIGREGPQSVFQVPGPLSLLALRCWPRDGG